MGFEHSVKVDLATAERVKAALVEFGDWAKERWLQGVKSILNDSTPFGRTTVGEYARRLLEISPEGADTTEISSCSLFRFPEDVVWETRDIESDLRGEKGPSLDVTRVRDYFPEDQWPQPGEGLLWWYEIAWLRKWSSEELRRFYELCEQNDALEVWASIIGFNVKYSDLMGEALAQAMPDAEIYDVTRYGSVKR